MTWWNRKSKPDDEPEFCPFSGQRGVPTKDKVEVLHEVRVSIKGNEPYLQFVHPRMIVQLTDQRGRSHQFFEGHADFFPILSRGDEVSFRLCRVTKVPLKWYERLRNWWSR